MAADIIMHLVVAGIVAGFMAGLLGIGGGIVTVPVMFVVFDSLGIPLDWRMQAAVGTSLLIIIATGFSSARAHHRKANVDWSLVRRWWWLLAAGGSIGALFAQTLRSDTLVYVFSTLAILLGLKMLVPVDRLRLGDEMPKGPVGSVGPLVIGTISGIMGIGGGSVSVPLMTIFGMGVHRAVGTASVIGVIVSITGMLSFLLSAPPLSTPPPAWTYGYIHLPTALIIASGAILVAPLGAHVAQRLPKTVLSITFGVFLLAAVGRLISSTL